MVVSHPPTLTANTCHPDCQPNHINCKSPPLSAYFSIRVACLCEVGKCGMWPYLSVLILCMIQELISSKVKTRGIRTGGEGLGLSLQSLGNLFLGQWRKVKNFGFSPSPSSIRYLLAVRYTLLIGRSPEQEIPYPQCIVGSSD